MLVFISWSGPRSKYVAEALENWLAQVIQAIEPWISQDIDKGLRWGIEIADRLERSKVGIICLTKSNLESKWIHYEAGALSKTKDAYVCTLLLDVKHVEVEQPLAQFQHTTTEKDQVLRLLKTINRLVGESGERSLSDSRLREIFETYWPRLEETFQEAASIQESATGPSRSDSEMLQEVLEILRSQERQQSPPMMRAFRDYPIYPSGAVDAFGRQVIRARLNQENLLTHDAPTFNRDADVEFIDKYGLDNYLEDGFDISGRYLRNGLRSSKSVGEFLNYISGYPKLDDVGRNAIELLYTLDDSYLTTVFNAAKKKAMAKVSAIEEDSG